MQNVPKAQFSAVINLIKAHSWITPRLHSLEELLLEDCTSKEEQTLIADLLSRFKYISTQNFIDKINELVLGIVTMPYLQPNETIIAAIAADSSPDSSQALVNMIKVKLQEHGWGSVKIVNSFGVAFKTSKNGSFKRKNIILVDEFVGSGRTTIGRVKTIRSQFENVEVDVNIFVNVVFSSVVGVDAVRNEGINFSCIETISRGISDFESPDELNSKLEAMISLEEKLSPAYGKYELSDYSMGYGKAESLFGIENWSIPNNVFPIFWWPENSKGATRKPLFVRYLEE